MAGVNPIGLDIGSSSLRAVEARRTKDDHSLTNFGQVPLPGRWLRREQSVVV